MNSFLKHILFALSLFLCFLIFNACNKSGEQEEAAEEHHEEANPDFVTLTEEQFKTVKIQLGSMEKKNLRSMIKSSGVLDLPPQNKASISSLIGGRITKINVIQGDFVEKGKTLAVVEHPDILRLQQDYLEAKSNFEYAEKEYQRQKELYNEKIVSGKKFQAAEADYKSQRALITSLENQLLQIGISPERVSKGAMIRSIGINTPIHGWVQKIEVNTGSYTEPAKEIFMVVDNHHVHIDLNVFEQDVSKVKEGQKVYFTLTNNPTEQYEATIFAVGKAFDENTRSVSVHADIKNNKNKSLLPGMYVDGRIEVEDSKTDALPDEAIVSEGNLKFIFVKVDSMSHEKHSEMENHGETEKEEHEGEETHGHDEESAEGMIFKKVQVTTGASDLGYTEVTPLEKLPANSRIVTKGAYFLSAQMKKGEGGDTHGH